MLRHKVDSSEFRSVGYHLPTSTLETEYQSGDIYRYFKVPARLVLEMLQADSIGRYFNTHIRPKFRYKKVR